MRKGIAEGDLHELHSDTMRVEQSATIGFVPFVGVEAYQDNATGIAPFGMFGANTATGELLYTSAANGFEVSPIIIDFGE